MSANMVWRSARPVRITSDLDASIRAHGRSRSTIPTSASDPTNLGHVRSSSAMAILSGGYGDGILESKRTRTYQLQMIRGT